MKRTLIRSTAFVRAARRLVKMNPLVAEDLRNALGLLSEDAFHPSLRTHKLKGGLTGFWASSAGYDLRIVFSFISDEEMESILLHTIGNHDEVY